MQRQRPKSRPRPQRARSHLEADDTRHVHNLVLLSMYQKANTTHVPRKALGLDQITLFSFQSSFLPSIEDKLAAVLDIVLFSHLLVLHQDVGDASVVKELSGKTQSGDACPRFDVDDMHRGLWDHIEKLEQVGGQTNEEASSRTVGENASRISHPSSNNIGGRVHESWENVENTKKRRVRGSEE